MKLRLETHPVSFCFLTPGIIGGADNRSAPAELRVPSIRGMLRWWHEAVHNVDSMRHLWGDAQQGTTASRIVIKFTGGAAFSPPAASAELLPHKPGSVRPAFPAGQQTHHLELVRLPGCVAPDEWERAKDICRLWLLLGGIGARQNRAAGSVWPILQPPETHDQYEKQCDALLSGSKIRCAVLSNKSFLKAEQARTMASDMIGGISDLTTQRTLESFDSPTGSAPFWRDPGDHYKGKFPRVSSPLKFKVGRFGAEHYLIAVWDTRNNTTKQLQDAVSLMLGSPSKQKRQIGELLEAEVFLSKGRGRLVA